MIGHFGRALRRAREGVRGLLQLSHEAEELKILTGAMLSQLIAQRGELKDIREAEFKVFSQFGEDGIIQYLIRRVGIAPSAQTFVEFGVASYDEANTRFLLVKDNWRGVIIDGDDTNMRAVREKHFYWRHNVNAVTAFIDRENINGLIRDGGLSGEIGILSVDIDGNDYWVWERIDVVDPIIVICEYNSIFGPDHAVSVPYDPAFARSRAHYSYLYYGCSLKACAHLAARKGYALVGSNSAGNNAFFVRRDSLNGLRELTVAEVWVDSQLREARDPAGRLTFLVGPARLDEIRTLPVVNVESGATEIIGELYG